MKKPRHDFGNSWESNIVVCGQCGQHEVWEKATGKARYVISYAELRQGYKGYICKKCYDVLTAMPIEQNGKKIPKNNKKEEL